MAGADPVIDIVLMPGEWFAGDARHRPRTLLGSCVSITLWQEALKVGAMCHFVLASRTDMEGPLDARYGDEALALMLERMRALGVAAAQCQAKIFGGASMLGGAPEALQVGQQNGSAARRLLGVHGIPIVSESLYGNGHRNIIFDIASGNVWARQARPAANAGERIWA